MISFGGLKTKLSQAILFFQDGVYLKEVTDLLEAPKVLILIKISLEMSTRRHLEAGT